MTGSLPIYVVAERDGLKSSFWPAIWMNFIDIIKASTDIVSITLRSSVEQQPKLSFWSAQFGVIAASDSSI
jgi:hypothetical protein